MYNVHMSKKTEKTHKHRNIIDDLLDLGLLVLMVIWYFTGIELDEKDLAVAGGIGASARVSLRRILMRIWEESDFFEAEGSESEGEQDEPDSGPESEESAVEESAAADTNPEGISETSSSGADPKGS